MNITILYSLPTNRLSNSKFSVTDDDTIEAANIIRKTCETLGMNVSMFPVAHDHPEKVLEITADCVFNLIEWTGGDILAAKKTYEYLDSMNIPYTGADWEGYVSSSEKTLMKKKFEDEGIHSPRSVLIPFSEQTPSIPPVSLSFPLIVKLASDHCSIGLERESVVYSTEELQTRVEHMMRTFQQDVLVEEFILGREFQVAALERDGEITVLPFMEIFFEKPEELNFLTFGGRWNEDHPDFQLSWSDLAEPVSTDVYKEIVDEGKRIFQLFHIHDYVRFDIRVRGNEVFFLEVNANPGIDDSLECGVTFGAHHAGISFASMIEGIVKNAIKRKKKENALDVKFSKPKRSRKPFARLSLQV